MVATDAATNFLESNANLDVALGMELPGIDPGASRMLSARSTI